MGAVTSQITSPTAVYSTVYSDTDQRKHQSSASLAFMWGIHRGPVNSPHKCPVTRKMFPFDDVIMSMWFCGQCVQWKIELIWLGTTIKASDHWLKEPKIDLMSISRVAVAVWHMSIVVTVGGRSTNSKVICGAYCQKDWAGSSGPLHGGISFAVDYHNKKNIEIPRLLIHHSTPRAWRQILEFCYGMYRTKLTKKNPQGFPLSYMVMKPISLVGINIHGNIRLFFH